MDAATKRYISRKLKKTDPIMLYPKANLAMRYTMMEDMVAKAKLFRTWASNKVMGEVGVT